MLKKSLLFMVQPDEQVFLSQMKYALEMIKH